MALRGLRGLFQQKKKNSIARVTPKRLRRKPKRADCFPCRDGKRYARQQAKKQLSLIFHSLEGRLITYA